MAVASVDPGTRPVPARASVMAAAEALLEYASGGRTDRDHESAQRGSAGPTEAIELSDRDRLQVQHIRSLIHYCKYEINMGVHLRVLVERTKI